MHINALTGLEPKNLHLYQLAFQHKSKHKQNNERLEFLGDSILDAVISEIIYKHFPNKDEGELSKLRSKMVSRNMLNKLANQLQLLQHLSYRETHTTQGLQNTEGNTLEALIGALYLDQGYDKSKNFILNKLIGPYVDWRNLENEIVDYKSLIYTHCQKEGKNLVFKLITENLENADERFFMALEINGEAMAEAYGKNKKHAEQKVAKLSLEKLGLI